MTHEQKVQLAGLAIIALIFLAYKPMGTLTGEYFKNYDRTHPETAPTVNAANNWQQSTWKTFTNTPGGYAIDYPSDIFVEDHSDWYGDVTKMGYFKLINNQGYAPKTVTLQVDIDHPGNIEEYVASMRTKGVTSCKYDECTTIPVIVEDTTLAGVAAYRLSYKESDQWQRVRTHATINNKAFSLDLIYPTSQPEWKEIYEKMLTSFKVVK